MKHGILTVTIYFITTMVLSMLSEIAYNESIFSTWWEGLIYVITVYHTSYYIAKKLLKD